jgi:hypothetical protein
MTTTPSIASRTTRALASAMTLAASGATAAGAAVESSAAVGHSGLAFLAIAFAAGLFLGMLLLLEVGRRLGLRRLAKDTEGARAGMGAVEGAVFALLGLLIAFTFSGAAARFDTRRQLIVAEANNIGTAWLRLDLLPPSAQPALRELFRQYVDSRLTTYRILPDLAAAKRELDHSTQIQGEIWKQAVAACHTPEGQRSAMLVLVSLNQMFDIVTDRTVALITHPPAIIFVMLAVLALASSLLAGFGMAGGRRRSWIHIVCFAAIMAICAYVILDLEFPRAGLIRVDAVDRLLVDLRRSMN